MDKLPEGFSCQIVNDMNSLYVDLLIPTGGRLTAEEAELLSTHLWCQAQAVRRERPRLALAEAKSKPGRRSKQKPRR